MIINNNGFIGVGFIDGVDNVLDWSDVFFYDVFKGEGDVWCGFIGVFCF